MFDILFEEDVCLEFIFYINETQYKMKYLLKNYTISNNELFGSLDISFSSNFMNSYFENTTIKTDIKINNITKEWLAHYILKNDIYINNNYINQSIINKIKIYLKTFIF